MDIEFETMARQEIQERIAKSKKILRSEVEIDMELEEVELRRIIFEIELKLFLNKPESERKIEYDEFRFYEKDFDKMKSYVKDDLVYANF